MPDVDVILWTPVPSNSTVPVPSINCAEPVISQFPATVKAPLVATSMPAFASTPLVPISQTPDGVPVTEPPSQIIPFAERL